MSVKKILLSTFYFLFSKGKRSAFTLIEMVVFTAIFSVTIIAFISVLISITRTQVRQSAVSEVNQQSQFVLQALQYYVERSSVIETDSFSATTTIKLRMTNTLEDPTLVYASGTQIFSKVGADPAQALTSNKVTISNFSMAKKSNAPGKDSLAVSFSISYNTQNPQQQFAQALQSSVARVNAATFDSGVFPNADGTLKLGATSQTWSSINDTIYFSAGKVGVGVSGPTQVLEVNGGVRLNTATAQPTCDANARGTLWLVNGGGGKDVLSVCATNASGTIAWRTLY